MRGSKYVTNSQTIDLPINITLPDPFITWNQSLSKYGENLVNINIIESALKEIDINTDLINFWKEIRIDLLTHRIMTTGEIMSKQKNYNIPLTAVIDKSEGSKIYDYTDYDAVSCDPGILPINLPETSSRINETILKKKTENILNYLNLALNNIEFKGDLPPVFDNNGNITSFYKFKIYELSDLLIMLSYNIPALNQLYKNSINYKCQYKLVMAACNYLCYYYLNICSKQVNAYNSLPIIEYLNKIEYGSAKIVLTHESKQLSFLDSMNICPYKYLIPFQSYIIIQSETRVKILYVAPKFSKKTNTFIQNKYTSKIIWDGSIYEWNQKIENIKQYLDPSQPEFSVKEAYPLFIL